LAPVLVLEVLVRDVAVGHRGVVVLVGVLPAEVLEPARHPPVVVRDVPVLVVVDHGVVAVLLELHLVVLGHRCLPWSRAGDRCVDRTDGPRRAPRTMGPRPPCAPPGQGRGRPGGDVPTIAARPGKGTRWQSSAWGTSSPAPSRRSPRPSPRCCVAACPTRSP